MANNKSKRFDVVVSEKNEKTGKYYSTKVGTAFENVGKDGKVFISLKLAFLEKGFLLFEAGEPKAKQDDGADF